MWATLLATNGRLSSDLGRDEPRGEQTSQHEDGASELIIEW